MALIPAGQGGLLTHAIATAVAAMKVSKLGTFIVLSIVLSLVLVMLMHEITSICGLPGTGEFWTSRS